MNLINLRLITLFVCFDLTFAENCDDVNAQFTTCGSSCPLSCAQRTVQRCIKNCVTGCFCKPDYVKNDEGKCVSPNQCPSSKNVDKRRKAPANNIGKVRNSSPNKVGKRRNAHAKKVGKRRNTSTNNVDERQYAPVNNVGKSRFIRNRFGNRHDNRYRDSYGDVYGAGNGNFYRDPSGNVVRDIHGNVAGNVVRDRYGNVVGTVTGNYVKDSFGNVIGTVVPQGIRPAPITPIAPIGYVRVLLGEVCYGQNEFFDKCGTYCPLTCNNYNERTQGCVLTCKPGCFCKPGFVRNHNDGKCVPLSECSNTKCNVQNEVFDNCGNSCPLTCENQTPPANCERLCVVGCVCKPGFIRNQKGFCVDPNYCLT